MKTHIHLPVRRLRESKLESGSLQARLSLNAFLLGLILKSKN